MKREQVEDTTLIAQRIVAVRTNGLWFVEATDEVGNLVSTKSETLSTGILICEGKLENIGTTTPEP